jgi:hypothetical protein
MNLTEEQVKEILAYLQELPTKYALPLIQYLDKIANEQKTEND